MIEIVLLFDNRKWGVDTTTVVVVVSAIVKRVLCSCDLIALKNNDWSLDLKKPSKDCKKSPQRIAKCERKRKINSILK